MLTRKLLRAEWIFNEETGTVTARTASGEITIDRTYAFSLARFLLRVFQRYSMKHRKKAKMDPGIQVVAEEGEEL